MKRSKVIAIFVAIGLMVAGLILACCAFAAAGWDLDRFNRIEFVTNTHQVEAPFSSIQIDGANSDVRLARSEDGTCRVVCNEADKIYHTVEVRDGVLTIRQHDGRDWFEHIGFFWGEMLVTVYLPESEYASCQIKMVSGDIQIDRGLSFGNADLKSTSGDVDLAASVTGALSIKTTSGDIGSSGATAESIHLESTSGDVSCRTSAEGTLSVKTVSGEIALTDAQAGRIELKSTSGDVELERCDADTLWIKSTSGQVAGTLLSGKDFKIKTVSGDVDVPSSSGGECQIQTTSGDIEIRIVE